MEMNKSFLRWAGSKKQLIPFLLPYWKGCTRYVEPFMGSAALFFALKPPSAFLSDINSELVETFVAVRNSPEAIHYKLQQLPLGKEAYYRIRQEDPKQMNIIDKAARFIYLNRFCFNGLYRTNLNGVFNVPYAASKTGRLPYLHELCEVASILFSAQIKARDFSETLKEVRSGDFVYIDPPYAVRNLRIFRQYGPDCFGTEDLARLATSLHNINRRKAIFLVSYALCDEALEAFDGWHIRMVQTKRSVAGFSQHRHKALEILVSNIITS